MSAFVVNTDHIDFMLQAATHYRDVYFEFEDNPAPVWYDNATRVGYALLTENIRSVAYRYDEPEGAQLPGPVPTPVPEDYIYNGSRAGMPELTPVNVISAIRCYEYQSCEHQGWQESAAYRFCERLTLAAIHHLPGFDDAPFIQWHVDHGVPVPPGYYEISRTIIVPESGAIVMDNSHVRCARGIAAIRFERPPDAQRDHVYGNVLIPEGWDVLEPFPHTDPPARLGTVRMGPMVFPV